MTLLTLLVLLVAGIAVLRFAGFAEPIAALIVVAILAVGVAPANLAQVAVFTFDFTRIVAFPVQSVVVAAIIAALLAGCHSAPRPARPLGWYGPGDASFFGVLPAAAVIVGSAFNASVTATLMSVVLAAVAVWLAMLGVGALARRAGKTAPAPSISQPLGFGALGLVLVLFPALAMMAAGLFTPTEALTFLSLPLALVLRLARAFELEDRPTAGSVQHGGIRGIGLDLLRGLADAAWIAFAMFAAHTATVVIAFVARDPGQVLAAALGVSAMSPVTAMLTIAVMVLILGVLMGPTVGAYSAAPIAVSFAKMAGVSDAAPAIVATLALVVSYARPSLGLSLLSPAVAGGIAAQRADFAQIAVWIVGVALTLVAAVLVANGAL
jgi:TRAP-type C4-dicarboxylate transport system permease large subunit